MTNPTTQAAVTNLAKLYAEGQAAFEGLKDRPEYAQQAAEYSMGLDKLVASFASFMGLSFAEGRKYLEETVAEARSDD